MQSGLNFNRGRITFADIMTSLKKTYLLTGANLGDRIGTLEAAREMIAREIGRVTKRSEIYETQAWGVADQPDYVNQALELATSFSAQEVLEKILGIEAALGRVRRSKWESRPIDIDILFYENEVLNLPHLILPHPHLHRRNFALIPMLEIAPDFVHPVFQKTIEELYDQSEDGLDVVLLDLKV